MDNNDPQQGAVEIQPVIKQEPPVMADHGAIGNHIQPQAPAQPQAQAQAQVVIDLGDEDAEYVTLRNVRRTVREEDAFTFIRHEYQELIQRQAKAAYSGSLQRKLQAIGLEVSSASRHYILDRHDKEWKKALTDLKKQLDTEVEEAEKYFRGLKRKEEQIAYSKILNKRESRLQKLRQDAKLRKDLALDLQDL